MVYNTVFACPIQPKREDFAISLPTIPEQKRALRAAMTARRDAISTDDAQRAGDSVLNRLASIPAFTTSICLLSYVEKGHELATSPILAQALRDGQRVMVPIPLDAGGLDWSDIDSLDALVPGRFGVPEPAPQHRQIATPPRDAVVLVPGLAFTPTGHRLGFGGGYFDRFLETHHGPSIGLAYDWQVLNALPTQPHDIPVAFIATPSTILTR